MTLMRMLSDVGNAINRAIQQAEEKIFDVEKTEYDDEYNGNINKLNILMNFTEKLIEETELMLEPNPAYRLEGKIMEKIDKKSDRSTPLENLGIAFNNASLDVKEYNYELYKDFSLCSKYEIKLGVTSKEFQNKATEVYVSKLQKMLNVDLKKYKEEEEILENLRLDYDSLRLRIKNSITDFGKESMEQEFLKVNSDFQLRLQNNSILFRSIDRYFELHRELLKEFIDFQSKFYLDCHSDLEKFRNKMESHSENSIKKIRIPKSIKVLTNESPISDFVDDEPSETYEKGLPENAFSIEVNINTNILSTKNDELDNTKTFEGDFVEKECEKEIDENNKLKENETIEKENEDDIGKEECFASVTVHEQSLIDNLTQEIELVTDEDIDKKKLSEQSLVEMDLVNNEINKKNLIEEIPPVIDITSVKEGKENDINDIDLNLKCDFSTELTQDKIHDENLIIKDKNPFEDDSLFPSNVIVEEKNEIDLTVKEPSKLDIVDEKGLNINSDETLAVVKLEFEINSENNINSETPLINNDIDDKKGEEIKDQSSEIAQKGILLKSENDNLPKNDEKILENSDENSSHESKEKEGDKCEINLADNILLTLDATVKEKDEDNLDGKISLTESFPLESFKETLEEDKVKEEEKDELTDKVDLSKESLLENDVLNQEICNKDLNKEDSPIIAQTQEESSDITSKDESPLKMEDQEIFSNTKNEKEIDNQEEGDDKKNEKDKDNKSEEKEVEKKNEEEDTKNEEGEKNEEEKKNEEENKSNEEQEK